MELFESLAAAWHANPISIAAIVVALFIAAIVCHRYFEKREAMREEYTRRSLSVGAAVKSFKYAEKIQNEKITAASLLEDIAKTISESETNGLRKTCKSVQKYCDILADCNTTLKNLERMSDKLGTGELTYGQLGTVDVSFDSLLDYFRDNFPVV